MKSLFESNLFPEERGEQFGRETEYLTEFLGMETMNKAKNWFTKKVAKSRALNQQRDYLARQQKIATNRAARANARRIGAEARKDPGRFVLGDFSKGMQNFERDFTDEAGRNSEELGGWMDASTEGHDERNANADAANPYDQESTNAFVGAQGAGGQSGGQPVGQPQQPEQPAQPEQPQSASQEGGQPQQPQGAPEQPAQQGADAGGGAAPTGGGTPVDPKVQKQVDYIQQKVDGVLNAIKAGKLNGNTINQQINPLVKQLQNVAAEYQASKAARPPRGGRKAPAQQPQKSQKPEQPQGGQEGGRPQQPQQPQQQATPQQESFERLFGSSIYL